MEGVGLTLPKKHGAAASESTSDDAASHVTWLTRACVSRLCCSVMCLLWSEDDNQYEKEAARSRLALEAAALPVCNFFFFGVALSLRHASCSWLLPTPRNRD